MEHEYTVWYYVKNLILYNKSQNNIYLPLDVIKLIFSFIILDLKRETNKQYIINSVKNQANRERNILNESIYFHNNNRYIQNEEIRVYLKNLPYRVTTLNELYCIVDNLIKYKGYTYKCYKYEGQVVVFEKNIISYRI